MKNESITQVLLGSNDMLSNELHKELQKSIDERIEKNQEADTKSVLNDIEMSFPELKILQDYHLRKHLVNIDKSLSGIKSILTFFAILAILSITITIIAALLQLA